MVVSVEKHPPPRPSHPCPSGPSASWSSPGACAWSSSPCEPSLVMVRCHVRRHLNGRRRLAKPLTGARGIGSFVELDLAGPGAARGAAPDLAACLAVKLPELHGLLRVRARALPRHMTPP